MEYEIVIFRNKKQDLLEKNLKLESIAALVAFYLWDFVKAIL